MFKFSVGLILAVTVLGLGACSTDSDSDPAPYADKSAAEAVAMGTGDPEALAVADRVMTALGGREAWNNTRYVVWDFFGARKHWWDRKTGDIRIEAQDLTILMNIESKEGRIALGGVEQSHPDSLTKYLDRGYALWINDSYWMFMPYKLRDPGAHLAYLGEQTLDNGTVCDVVSLTFAEDTGLTPQNKYDLFVSKADDHIVQWAFYASAEDPEPRFSMPWAGWQTFGRIRLATDHGREKDWGISVPDTLPANLFKDF